MSASIAPHVRIRNDILGKDLTSFKIGGTLRQHIEINSEDGFSELSDIVETGAGAPRHFLGAGSNLVIPTAGMDAPIIQLGKAFNYCRPLTNGEFEIGGATPLPSTSARLTQEGYSGMEFAAGIPGTLGGGIRMNCGAHGGEIGSRVVRIKAFSFSSRKWIEMQQSELAWTYRAVNIPHEYLIVSAILKFSLSDKARCTEERQRCLDYRKKTQPLTMPSAGSVFRNPSPDQSAGALLESCGLKGTAIGGAEVSTLHANWIVNPQRTAMAEDVAGLVSICQAKAAKDTGIKLKSEIIFW